MFNKDNLIFGLYIIALVGSIFLILDFWAISITILVVLIITLLIKISLDEKMESAKERRVKIIELVSEKLQNISNSTKKLGNELDRNMDLIEEKVMEEKRAQEIEMDKQYRDISKKIIDVENKINKLKKTVGAGLGSLEERMNIQKNEEEDIERRLSEIFRSN